jgi:putative hydroxymethylpyrimidine transport system permease protein
MRPLITAFGLLAAWEALVRATGVPSYILPPPSRVAVVMVERIDLLLEQAAWTAAEMVLGLALGLAIGGALAVVFAFSPGWRRWALPLVIVSQAIPVIALAPLLVLWLGYGMASKVAMAALVIFFPVVSTLYDGLRRTDPGWLDLARTMDATPRATLLQIRLPAALPAFASGARIAAAVAPIGAVIGEWVGASAGLGYLMTQQLARGQTPLAFAALVLLCLLGLGLYYAVDRAVRYLVPWQSQGVQS